MQSVLFDPPTREQLLDDAGPVLKWAGGKTQLLPELRQRYPKGLASGEITTYIEPFFGGGSVFFDLVKTYPQLQAILFDVNPELVVLYRVVQCCVDDLIDQLESYASDYLARDEDARKVYYYEVRDAFNAAHDTFNFTQFGNAWIERAAQTIFLNRTCFNGLFRVNSKGYFNVPAGRYKNPTIVNETRLQAASMALQRADIHLGDFSQARQFMTAGAFVYYDPPYRPISTTSSFTAYAEGSFDDAAQHRLAALFREADSLGVKQLLSNSDPTNHGDDPFFDELYQGFTIERVAASRMINSVASNRGAIREIIVRNYAS